MTATTSIKRQTAKTLASSLMRLTTHCSAIFSTIAITTLPTVTFASPPKNSIDLYRVPEANTSELNELPKNLARWHMGASLVLPQGDQLMRVQVGDISFFNESIFLSDNSALSFPIQEGTHNFIVDFGDFTTVSRVFVANESAAGSMELYSNNTLEPLNSSKWRPMARPVNFKAGEIPVAEFPEIETRYIQFRFTVSEAGRLGNFGATGPLTIGQTEIEFGKGDDTEKLNLAASPLIGFDFAGIHTGTRIVYVSGGPVDKTHYLLDDDPTTTYNFPAGEECVLFIDLRKGTLMSTLASSFRTETPGTLQIYMVDTLPTHFDHPQDTAVATHTLPDGSVERTQFASTRFDNFEAILAALQPHQVVRVPESYFKGVENSYNLEVTPDTKSISKTIDEIERRYVIYRFLPGSTTNAAWKPAKYIPGSTPIITQQVQSAPTSFGSVQVLGNIEFEDIVLTRNNQPLPPIGATPPPAPPEINKRSE